MGISPSRRTTAFPLGKLADDVRRRLDLLHGTNRLPGVVGHGLDLAGAPAGRRRRHEARQG
jgi:hypothetical protein